MLLRMMTAAAALAASATAADATVYYFDNFHQAVCCRLPYSGAGQVIGFSTAVGNGTATLADLAAFDATDTRALDPASYVDVTLASLTSFSATIVDGTVTDYAFTGRNTFAPGLRFSWSFAKGQEVPYAPQPPAVPEPATWATMMVGMMAVGYALRRRRLTLART